MEEPEALPVHPSGQDLQNHRFAVTRPDGPGRFTVRRKMYVQTVPRMQSVPRYGFDRIAGRSVEENLVRILARRQKLFEDIFSAWDEGGRPEQVTLDGWLRDTRKLARELLKDSSD